MEHRYRVRTEWTGNRGQGTRGYRDYDRSVTLSAAGKPDILAYTDEATGLMRQDGGTRLVKF